MYKLVLTTILSLIFLLGCNFNEEGDVAPETAKDVNIAYPSIGMTYVCSSGIVAYTDEQGVFSCNQSDNVTFYLGEIKITTLSEEGDLITPYDLFDDDNEAALNYVKLLEVLNDNPDENGTIILSAEDLQKLPKDLDFSSSTFVEDIEAILLQRLISTTEAQEILNKAVLDTGGSIPDGSNQPIAVIGTTQVDTLVTLNATGSSDADGDPLTYLWTLRSPSGSVATLSSTTQESVTFTADKQGLYTVGLIVNDSKVNSTLVEEEILIALALPPIANAGADQTVLVSDLVTLDALGSSGEGEAISYMWSLIVEPIDSNISLSSTTIAQPTFTPIQDGNYTFDLNVSSINGSSIDSVVINVGIGNVQPVADAGSPQDVLTSSIVNLSGIDSSDANLGDTLTYSWSISTQPTGSSITLSGANTVNPSFTPYEDGDYIFALVVNDSLLDSAPSFVTIRSSTANIAPVANAGINQDVPIGSSVTMDANSSSDANGDALTYLWTLYLPVSSSASLDDNTSVSPTFTADVNGTYTLDLVVNDGSLNSNIATVFVQATAANSIPTANAGSDGVVDVSIAYQLDGNGSFDSNGDTLTYQWSVVSGGNGTFSDATSVSPTFTPDVSGSYVLKLIVNDGLIDSLDDTMILTVNTVERLKKTGQIISYIANDDGDTQIGESPDHNLSASTIKDEVTSLTWYNVNITGKTFLEAEAFCSALDVDGINTWRLPSQTELWTIADFNNNPSIDSLFVSNASPEYWATEINDGYNVVVDFITAETKVSTGINDVLCVSGQRATNSFIRDDVANIVEDKVHKLMWQDDELRSESWLDSIGYCESLSLGGYNDWRLPNIFELLSIVDFQNTNAIFNAYFHQNPDEAWSSTTSPQSTDFAITVHNGATSEALVDGNNLSKEPTGIFFFITYDKTNVKCVRSLE